MTRKRYMKLFRAAMVELHKAEPALEVDSNIRRVDFKYLGQKYPGGYQEHWDKVFGEYWDNVKKKQGR